MPTGTITKDEVLKGGQLLADAINNQGYVFHPWQNVFYVQSVHLHATDLNNQGKVPSAPLRTLTKAVSLAVAGDVIIVGPGHLETISATNALSITKAGLYILGVGAQGGQTTGSRPTITVGTATTDKILISAANVRIGNFTFSPGIDSLAIGIEVTGTDFVMEDCSFIDSASIQCLNWIKLNGSHRAIVRRCMARQQTAGAAMWMLITTILTDSVQVLDNDIAGDYSTGAISVTSAITNVRIGRNNFDLLNANNVAVICGGVAATGIIFNNFVATVTAIASVFVVIFTVGSATWKLFNNYCADASGGTGALIGTPAT